MKKTTVQWLLQNLVAVLVGTVTRLGLELDRNSVSFLLAWKEMRRAVSKARYVYQVKAEVARLKQKPGGFWSQPTETPKLVTPGLVEASTKDLAIPGKTTYFHGHWVQWRQHVHHR